MSYLAHTCKVTLGKALEAIETATVGIHGSYDYVLVTGLSGVVPGAIFCHQHNKELVVQRKAGESSHGEAVEGPYGWDHYREPGDLSGEYIIIDDFIVSGKTLDRLLDAHGNQRLPKYVILYNFRSSTPVNVPPVILDTTEVPGRYTIRRSKP